MKRYRFKSLEEIRKQSSGFIEDMYYLCGQELYECDAALVEVSIKGGKDEGFSLHSFYKGDTDKAYWRISPSDVEEIKEDPKPVDIWDIDFVIADMEENGAVYGFHDGGGAYLIHGKPAVIWARGNDSAYKPYLLTHSNPRYVIPQKRKEGKAFKMQGTNEAEMVEKLRAKKRKYDKEND